MTALCTKCRLSKTRDRIVVGRGALPAPLLLIGEGPGGSEDMLGEAFIGPAGHVLDAMLAQAGYVDQFYATNCVHCHPTDRLHGENRAPAPDEILACMPRVSAIIQRCAPRAVILLGKVASHAYGNIVSQPALHLTHPAALLRSGGVASPGFLPAVYRLRHFLNEEGLLNGSQEAA